MVLEHEQIMTGRYNSQGNEERVFAMGTQCTTADHPKLKGEEGRLGKRGLWPKWKDCFIFFFIFLFLFNLGFSITLQI